MEEGIDAEQELQEYGDQHEDLVHNEDENIQVDVVHEDCENEGAMVETDNLEENDIEGHLQVQEHDIEDEADIGGQATEDLATAAEQGEGTAPCEGEDVSDTAEVEVEVVHGDAVPAATKGEALAEEEKEQVEAQHETNEGQHQEVERNAEQEQGLEGEQEQLPKVEGEDEHQEAQGEVEQQEVEGEVVEGGEQQEVAEEEEEEDIQIEIVEDPLEPVEPPFEYKFPISKSINKRIYLYLGEIYKLPCDAIVVGQVESLTDRHDGNDVIFTLAGIELEPELADLAPCSTGDSVISRGWQMPCEWIIHSVGPKYDERYLNASDHALFSAYKSALLLAAEKEVQSLVIGTIYKHTKRYPRFDAAHVALRTVRKFLQHPVGDTFDRVMFCVNTQEDFEIYSALMHAYFPRTPEELHDQLNLLPIELGDEWGEVIIPDRVVKVSVGPKPLPVESLQQYKGSEETKELGAQSSGSSGSGPRKLGQCVN